MALKLGELVTILTADDGPLRRGLATAKRLVDTHGQQVRSSALGAATAVTTALASGAVPALAVATTAGIGLGAALAGAGAAATVFKAAVGGAFADVQEAAEKTDQLREKIELLGARAKLATGAERTALLEQQAAATAELRAQLSLLDPNTRKAAEGLAALKDGWKGFIDANRPESLSLITQGMTLLRGSVGKLQPLYDVTAVAASRFLDTLTGWADGGGVERMVAFLSAQAGPALDNLLRIGRNLAVVVGRFFTGFADQGQGVLDWLADASDRWAAWATQTDGGGLQALIGYVQDNGPTVASALSSLADAAVAIAKALGPLAPVSTAIAGALAAIIAAVPPGVITAVVSAWLAYGLALKAYAAYAAIASAATKVWAAVQAVMNLALWTSPITWIVLGVVALIAVIYLVATRTKWFQQLWAWAWGGIKRAASAVGSWFVNTLWKQWILGAWRGIVSAGKTAWDWMKSLPGKIKTAFAKVTGFITAPFRLAFNAIARLWNGTVGGMSFTAPDWVPGIGGKGFSMPTVPYLNVGGRIRESGLAMVHRGERVIPAARAGALDGGGATVRHVHEVRLVDPDGDTVRTWIFDGASARGLTPGQYLKVA